MQVLNIGSTFRNKNVLLRCTVVLYVLKLSSSLTRTCQTFNICLSNVRQIQRYWQQCDLKLILDNTAWILHNSLATVRSQ